MSWHVNVYPQATREAFEKLASEGERDALFENYDALPKFPEEHRKAIEAHLERRGYRYDAAERRYVHQEHPGATVMLTDHAAYFMGKGGDATMEISMTSGEFTYHFAIPKGVFAVWDPQDQKWMD
jgi:hypothetical protein